MTPLKVSLSSILTIVFTLLMATSEAQLSPSFYSKRCPNALSTIQSVIKTAISRERRMAASLLRLHFHDCFVQGCDGSLLLDDGPSIQSEKNARQNLDSARGFEVIDQVKSRLENICPGVVSCADILAVAARDASASVGGPTWDVKLGRRDSTTASKTQAEADLPSTTSSLNQLLDNFKRNGLDSRDLVALSGAHTIGQAQCVTFRARLYNNDTNIDDGFKITRRRNCPSNGGDANPASLDLVTPKTFDNIYFKNLVQKKGLLHSDQVLFSGGSTDSLVTEYSRNSDTFYLDFGEAMIKMGDIRPLTGSSGQIRRICTRPN